MGRATSIPLHYRFLLTISIHALRGEGDIGREQKPIIINISIHALRGEGDDIVEVQNIQIKYFNPRPPWGGRLIHVYTPFQKNKFQSTPSVGRATSEPSAKAEKDIISIHALRGEGDCKNIQICNAMLVHSAYKTIYFCNSCAFYLA